MGLAWRIGMEGVVPLWTFGKMTNLWDAAEAQIKVGEADVNKQKNQVRMDVRRAFFGLQLSRDSLALLGEATDGSTRRSITSIARSKRATPTRSICSSCGHFATSSTGARPRRVATRPSLSRRSAF